MGRNENKWKIVLSLLVATAFILSAASTLATPAGVNTAKKLSIEKVKAGDVKTRDKISQNLPMFVPIKPASEVTPLANSWSIGIINPSASIPPGDYDVTVVIHNLGPGSCCVPPGGITADIYAVNELPPETICCYDMESAWDIYNYMEVQDYDVFPDPNGVIDTWTLSDKRSSSASHSFHCTQFDKYMGNQYDELMVYCLDPTISLKTATGPATFELSYDKWVEGESIDLGGGYVTAMDYLDVYYIFTTDPVPKSVGAGGTWWFGGYIETYVDSTSGWETNTDTIVVPAGTTGIALVFAWTSNPVVEHEGAYIDNVCFKYVPSEKETKIWQGFNQEEKCFDECIPTEYTFPLKWHAEEGDYVITATVDGCGGSATATLNVHVGTVHDIGVTTLSTNSPDVMQDLEITADVCNVGNVGETNVPVKASVSSV
ncbi:MAG: hypothetical protein DRP23_06925, partial [Thermotogae bacterium]